jgi:hypothetical protein
MGIEWGQLPDWSKTIDDQHKPDYSALRPLSIQFVMLAREERRQEVKVYSERYCFPRLDLRKASGLYLLFRLVFKVSNAFPRQKSKVFGGWLHPSIDDGKKVFNLAWPISIDEVQKLIAVERFQGYFGKGYDALAEYDYFVETFPVRTKDEIEELSFT